MYEDGMRFQLTPKPSSKSQTPVTLLSERHWERLNPTLLADSISLRICVQVYEKQRNITRAAVLWYSSTVCYLDLIHGATE